MDIIGYHISGLIGVGATFTSVLAAFTKFDADQSEKNREFVRDWLFNLKVDNRRWADFFTELFGRIFGRRHFSAKCLGRSALLSAALILAIFAYWLVTFPRTDLLRDRLFFNLAWPVIVGFTITAVITDYLTLWKTRLLLTRPNLVASGLISIGVVVMDAIATMLVFIFFIASFHIAYSAIVIYFFFDQFRIDSNMVLSVVQSELATVLSWPRISGSPEGLTRALYLAPLLTSAWLWIYLIVAYVMRAVARLTSWLKPLSKVMDFELHPVRTIGYATATVSAVVVGVATAIF